MHPGGPITDQNPYVLVRWKPEDVRVPIQLRRRALFIPRQFEAGIVSSGLDVVLYLEATAALSELYAMARQEPPQIDGDVLVKRVEVRTDRYSFVTHEDFRRIPLKKWTRYAVAAAARTRSGLRALTEGRTAEEWLEKKSFAELAPTPVGRPPNGIEFMWRGRAIGLNEVNEVATAGAPHHVKAVQEHFGDPGDPVPRETARRWIRNYERLRKGETH